MVPGQPCVIWIATNLRKLNNSTKLFKPLSVALSVPVPPCESGTMAPCGLPVLTGREWLFTAGQDTQLSGRRAPFLRLSPPPPPLPLPHRFLDTLLLSLSLCVSGPSSQLSPPSLWRNSASLTIWPLLNSSSAHFHLLSLLPRSDYFSPSSPQRNLALKFPCHTFFPWTNITFLQWHFSCFFNSFISSLPICAHPSQCALSSMS